MILQLYYYDHPVLRQHAKLISEITDEIRQFARDMVETMYASDGLGLAAPQVGRSIRLFVLRDYVETEDGQWTFSQPKVYINPKLTVLSKKPLIDTEGCLSIPGIRLEVARPERIKVTALDLEGIEFTEEVVGYNARIRMHENDHLNGTLFIDRVDDVVYQKIEPELRAIKQKYGVTH